MKLIFPTIILLFIASVVFLSCDDTLNESNIDNVIIPDKNVSYNEYIQPVLTIKCSTSGCHNDESMAGGYSVTSWSNVVTPGIVNPGNVETSILVWRIEGIGVEIMPPIGNLLSKPLTENQIKGIRTWIEEGAKSN
jgi:hypothetical protein